MAEGVDCYGCNVVLSNQITTARTPKGNFTKCLRGNEIFIEHKTHKDNIIQCGDRCHLMIEFFVVIT